MGLRADLLCLGKDTPLRLHHFVWVWSRKNLSHAIRSNLWPPGTH